MNNVTTLTTLDTRRVKQDGTYPIKLRITFERKQKYYTTPYSITEEQFEKLIHAKRLSNEEKTFKDLMLAFEIKARDVIKLLPNFSWTAFEKKYFENRAAKEKIIDAFKEYALKLRSSGRIGTAVSYECAQNSLEKYFGNVKFSEITPDSLNDYETWMLGKGRSVTSVGIYLRSLRTLFNNAIEDGLLSKEFYPFGKKKYEIPTGKNVKKALTIEDIGKIVRYEPNTNSMACKARDIWFFMYLSNGINIKDLCLLKYENIKGDMVVFNRAKTVRTKRVIEPITFYLMDEINTIIEKWGNKDKSPSNYIFPILTKGLSLEKERQLIQQFTHVVNSHMKKIGNDLEIKIPLTTYVARHSFATILQRSGVSTGFISEALGHGSEKTTSNYLAGFEDEAKRNISKSLTAYN